jgi:uncharacterized membrane protein
MRQQEVSRLEAFSDAVFGFSATLLVVSLEVPKTFPELLADLKGFVAFGLGFAALVLIWSIHNKFFRRYGLQDPLTVFLNSCLLFVVLFFVYPLKFVTEGIAHFWGGLEESGRHTLSSFDELASLFIVYGLAFAAVFLCFTLLYVHAHRRAARLGLSELEKVEAFLLARNYALYTGVGLLSVLTAWSKIGIQFAAPGCVYFLLGPLGYWHGADGARRKAAVRAAAV